MNREEIAADLVWRYVEHVRAARAEGSAAELSRAELEQLVETLDLVGRVPEALCAERAEDTARRAAVRRRLETAVTAATAERPSPARSGPWLGLLSDTSLVPAWRFRAAFAAAMALALALATTSLWHRPTVVVKRVRVPVEAASVGIEPVEEALVHDLLPRMLRSELSPRQEKNLMWHMIVCSGCFDEYVQLRQSGRTVKKAGGARLRLVTR